MPRIPRGMRSERKKASRSRPKAYIISTTVESVAGTKMGLTNIEIARSPEEAERWFRRRLQLSGDDKIIDSVHIERGKGDPRIYSAYRWYLKNLALDKKEKDAKSM